MVTAKFALTPEEVESFEKNGYFGPFKVYEPEEIAAAWKKLRPAIFDRSHAAYEIGQSGSASIANYDRHLDLTFLSNHICRPQIVHRVQSALGPDVLCWRTEFFPKYPGVAGTPWHQNDTFCALSGKEQLVWPPEDGRGGALTVWCAFTDSTIENGCLKLMPGTQGMRFYDEKSGFKGRDVVSGFGYDFKEIQFDPNWTPDESKAFPLVMKAGECVAFWSVLLHGSYPNLTKAMRMGFAGRYVPTQVKIYPETELVEEFGEKISLDKWGAVLVAGKDTHSHNRIISKNLRGESFPICA